MDFTFPAGRWKRSMGIAFLAAGLVYGVTVSESAAGQTLDSLAAQVRAAETAFAKTMADRDLNAFEQFLSQEAVFFGSQDILRHREEVAMGWRSYFEGEEAPFSWAPETVEVLDSGTLALSTGPVLDPQGKKVGTFNSIWRLEPDGKWRVVFDKGCPPCNCPPSKAGS